MLNTDSKEYKEIINLFQTFIIESNKLEEAYNQKEKQYRQKKGFDKNNKMLSRDQQMLNNLSKADNIDININSLIISFIHQNHNNYSIQDIRTALSNAIDKIREVLA